MTLPQGFRSPLLERIRREIRHGGPIPFARFMELALYDPDAGYYSRAGRLGPSGDYFTASDTGRAFGRCLARQILEIDRTYGPFDPFHVIEFGSGRGLLARDILDTVSQLDTSSADRLRYVMVDRSRAMREQAVRQAPAALVVSPDELTGTFRGCVLAVELFDAVPVHRLRRRAGEMVEVHVDLDASGRLIEFEGPADPHVEELARRYGAAAEEGSEAEVAPQALHQLDLMARLLDRGVWIVVDYGGDAADLYGPQRRRGTLLAYHRHTMSQDYLARVGEQDLTAHVNFTALEDRAVELGLRVLGRTTQDRFLIANGILEAFEDANELDWRDPRRVKARLQAKQLIDPSSMGRRFQVLLLGRGCDPAPTLSGLRDPFARSAG